MIISVSGMGGIAPKIIPELLADNLAQTASNVRLYNGGVGPLANPSTIATPTKTGVKQSIYRFGRGQPETQYWFSWMDRVSVVKSPMIDDTQERTYFTGDGVPKVTDLILALSGGTDYPVASYNLGVPAPTTAPTLETVEGTGPTTTETRAYVYTNVTAWGEESSPSPASTISVGPGLFVRMSAFDGAPTGSYNITKRYLYRSITSSSGTNYYYVGEILVAATQFDDNTLAADIGEPIMSMDWTPPPATLEGLISLPSGALAGFVDKVVWMSEPNIPYAWPAQYKLTTDYPIVAVAPMGQGFAVLTEGWPYIANSNDPATSALTRVDVEQSCVSRRSVVSMGGSVIYASPDGLVELSPSGSSVITETLFDRAAWQLLNPSTIHAVLHDGRYYGFHSTGGFIYDPKAGMGAFTTHDIVATASHVDPVSDALYLAIGNYIQKFGAGSSKTATWKTKIFDLPKPTNFACAQIKASSLSDLTFKMYVDGVLKFTKAVTSRDPFRLPSGFKGRRFEFELSGTSHWSSFHVAESMQELANV